MSFLYHVTNQAATLNTLLQSIVARIFASIRSWGSAGILYSGQKCLQTRPDESCGIFWHRERPFVLFSFLSFNWTSDGSWSIVSWSFYQRLFSKSIKESSHQPQFQSPLSDQIVTSIRIMTDLLVTPGEPQSQLILDLICGVESLGMNSGLRLFLILRLEYISSLMKWMNPCQFRVETIGRGRLQMHGQENISEGKATAQVNFTEWLL